MRYLSRVHKEAYPDYVDSSKRIRLSAVLSLAQQAAVVGCDNIGATKERTMHRGLLWVVAKYHFEIDRLPTFQEKFDVLTWKSRTIAYFFTRNFEFVDKDDHAFIRGTSAWALIDENKREMIRPEEYGLACKDYVTGREIPMPRFLRIEPGDKEATIKANYSLCDFNGHMNNVHYLDLCIDLIPIEYLATHEPTSFDITYKKEFPLGAEMKVSYAIEEDEARFVSERFSLLIKFKKSEK